MYVVTASTEGILVGLRRVQQTLGVIRIGMDKTIGSGLIACLVSAKQCQSIEPDP